MGWADATRYYEGGIASTYLWDLDDSTWAGVVLFKKGKRKRAEHAPDIPVLPDSTNSWDSIHVLEANNKLRSTHYRLTSTVMLNVNTRSAKISELNLSGSLTRQAEQSYPVESPSSHVSNIGRMVEDMEIRLRGQLQEVYFGKTRDIVNDVRSVQTLSEAERDKQLQQEMVNGLERK